MNYLNLHTDLLRSEEYIGAEPLERATWLSLLAWCATQENGGIIADCKNWSDRKWQQICGITKSEVETISELYEFKDDNLVVNFYPIESENTVKAKRENGNKGGRPKQTQWEKPCGYPKPNHMDNHEVNLTETTRLTETEPQAKRKEKKGKEMEGKEKKRTPPLSPSGEWDQIFPSGSKNKSAGDQKKTKVMRNNELMVKLGALFNRQEGTLWSVYEAKALQTLNPSKESLEAILNLYLKTNYEYKRGSLETLLNNWMKDTDTAMKYMPKSQPQQQAFTGYK